MPTGPGHEARIAPREPLDGRKQFSGTLEGSTATPSSSPARTASLCPAFSDIASAKLLLTDKLINATAPLSTEGADHIQTEEE